MQYDSLGPVLSAEELACYPIILPCDTKRQADLVADFFEAAGLLVTVAQNSRGWYTTLDHRARTVLA